jgi:septal ring factor EnvC (AmiA/AmiB activator)
MAGQLVITVKESPGMSRSLEAVAQQLREASRDLARLDQEVTANWEQGAALAQRRDAARARLRELRDELVRCACEGARGE